MPKRITDSGRLKETTDRFYLTSAGNVVFVTLGGWSIHFENEEPDGFIDSPFTTRSAQDMGWREVDFADLPEWAKDQIDV